MIYPGVNFTGSNLTADIFTVYGESPGSLEKIAQRRIPIESVSIIDNCKLSVKQVSYSVPLSGFVVSVSNDGGVDCWVDVEIADVLVNKRPLTFSLDGSLKLAKGKHKDLVVKAQLDDIDLKDLHTAKMTVFYGEREDALVNLITGSFEVIITRISMTMIVMAVVGLVILLLLILLILRWYLKRDFF